MNITHLEEERNFTRNLGLFLEAEIFLIELIEFLTINYSHVSS